MRAIKFRAKIKDGDEWKYGGGVQVIGSYALMLSDDGGRGVVHLVQPDTVGQFTGLLDRAGREIYEGDIVRYDDYQGIAEIGFKKIEFSEKVEFKGGCFYPVCNQPPYTFEVIGNLYETPELLK